MENTAPRTLGEFAEKNLDLTAVRAGAAKSAGTDFGFKAYTDAQVTQTIVDYNRNVADTALRNLAVRNLFGSRGKKLFVLAWAGMKKETDRIVNNDRLQELEFDAAKSAAEAGLSGGAARAAALVRLKADLAEIGLELADRLVDTLLQIGYMHFRDTEG